MDLSVPMSTSARAAFVHSKITDNVPDSQSANSQSSQLWQPLPASARNAMRRTLGGHRLAPLPASAKAYVPPLSGRAVRTSEKTQIIQKTKTSLTSTTPEAPVTEHPSPLGFVALLSAYRPSGGTVRSDDLSHHVHSQEPGHLTNLSRKLVSGAILSFPWRQTLWVPMFQFDAAGGAVKPVVARVIEELKHAFDSWEISVWFVQPNPWLNDQRPVDLLGKSDAEVLHAAEVDRFVAMG